MSAALTATPQVEADKRLIQFATYEDYLNSLVTKSDHCYLQSTSVSRTIAELGYRSSGETLTREQFEKRLAAVIEYLYPTFKPYVLASEGVHTDDPFLKEMALRERPNRLGILARVADGLGLEIATLKRIKAQSLNNPVLSSPRKKRPRKKPKTLTRD